MARKILVVTGSRADFGHLAPVCRAIISESALTLQIVACGQHLDPRFGETWKEIAEQGFAIDGKVDIGLGDDTPLATAEATGRAVSGLAESFAKLKPDIVLVLGDRFEILAAGVAALLLNIPLAHTHGGELTEAAMDDAIRHALTKMAALHFAAAEPYAVRIRQMGEDPRAVFVTGAPGLDALARIDFLGREALARDLGLDLGGQFFVVTFHPVTLASDQGARACAVLTEALAGFPDAEVVITGVNSDPGHAGIAASLAEFAAAKPQRRKVVTSLGQRRYLSAVKVADAVIGNSSSGLIEAPALGVPTVNIGDRQKGRLRSASVIDCPEEAPSIRAAITMACDPTFRQAIAGTVPAYGRGGAAAKIVAVLEAADLAHFRSKVFHDIIRSE